MPRGCLRAKWKETEIAHVTNCNMVENSSSGVENVRSDSKEEFGRVSASSSAGFCGSVFNVQ